MFMPDDGCPRCKSRNILGVQYGRGFHEHPCHYDGVSEWQCRACGLRVGRWSERILEGDDHEAPGDGEHGSTCPLRPPETVVN